MGCSAAREARIQRHGDAQQRREMQRYPFDKGGKGGGGGRVYRFAVGGLRGLLAAELGRDRRRRRGWEKCHRDTVMTSVFRHWQWPRG